MGDYSGMGSAAGYEPGKIEKPKKKKGQSVVWSQQDMPKKEGAEETTAETPRNDGSAAAEGLVPLTPDVRRRQRSIIGSLAREETKVTTTSLHVQEVRRLAHVTFDPETQKFVGLPTEWEAAINTHFGLPLALCRSTKLPAYKSRIPDVLIKMGKYLLDHDGRNVKGIFRIAPDQNERDAVLVQLANGTFVSCTDIHCVSTGIKVWFRELPVHIFRDLDEDKVRQCDSDAEAAAIMSRFPEPGLSVLQWLMDLCCEIINNSTVNLMTAKNMSIVVTPNLYRVKEKTGDPTDMLFLAKKFTDFFERCLNNRIAQAKTRAEAGDSADAETKAEGEADAEGPRGVGMSSITFTIELDDGGAVAPSPKMKPETMAEVQRDSKLDSTDNA